MAITVIIVQIGLRHNLNLAQFDIKIPVRNKNKKNNKKHPVIILPIQPILTNLATTDDYYRLLSSSISSSLSSSSSSPSSSTFSKISKNQKKKN